MSNLDSDYNSATRSQNYSTLSCYNPLSAAQAKYTGVAKQIIPSYSAPGYNTLQHGAKPTGEYFSYGNAYGYASGCNQKYTARVCGGCQTSK
jgi:hypothetical protein